MTKPYPLPFEVLRRLVDDLEPAERGRLVGQVQGIQARFKALEDMLRKAGLGD